MKPQKFYFDSQEDDGEGPTPETSHPNFNKTVREDFYYDCVDEFAPFGNDAGSDALSGLEDWYRDTKGEGDILKFLEKYFDSRKFGHPFADYAWLTDEAAILKMEEKSEDFLDFLDQTILSFAFGQAKITGKIDTKLKELGMVAIQRQKFINEQGNYTPHAIELSREYRSYLDVMEADLKKF